MDDYTPKWQHLADGTPASVTHNRECKVCGHGFNASRSDAKYCSQNCRKAQSRKSEKMKRETKKAIHAIEEIRTIAGDDKKLLALAARLEDEIFVTLAGVTDKYDY